MSINRRTFLKSLGGIGASTVFPTASAAALYLPPEPIAYATIDAMIATQPFINKNFMYFFMKYKKPEPSMKWEGGWKPVDESMTSDVFPVQMSLEINKGVANFDELGRADFLDVLLDHSIPFERRGEIGLVPTTSGKELPGIIFDINRASNDIARLAGRARGNVILTNKKMAAILREYDQDNPVKVHPSYKIFESDRKELDGKIIVGYRSKTAYDFSIMKTCPKDKPWDFKYVVADTVPSYFRTLTYEES